MNTTWLLTAGVGLVAVIAVSTTEMDAVQTADLVAFDNARGEVRMDKPCAVPARDESAFRLQTEESALPPTVADGTSAAAQFATLVAAMQRGDTDMHVVVELRDLLHSHPELASTFAEVARHPQTGDRVGVRLAQALERCGDAHCQVALTSIADDSNAAESIRTQAVRSLGSVPQPTEATVASLWAMAHAPHQRTDEAMLAFGRATASAKADDQSLHHHCCDSIRMELRRSTDPSTSRVLLKALAAAGYTAIADEAVTLLGAADADLRATAAYVLLSCNGPQVEAIARDLLAVEHDQEVRRIVVRGLQHRGKT